MSCWFATLQEISSIAATVLDTNKDGGGAAGTDASGADSRSANYSFTSAGKALASRSSGSHGGGGGHHHGATAGIGGGGIGNMSGVVVEDDANSRSIAIADDLTMDDLSGSGAAHSKPYNSNNNYNSKGATASTSATASSTGSARNAPAGVSSNAVSTQQQQQQPQPQRAVDAGMRAIIGDMVRAVEVAVWDAAFER